MRLFLILVGMLLLTPTTALALTDCNGRDVGSNVGTTSITCVESTGANAEKFNCNTTVCVVCSASGLDAEVNWCDPSDASNCQPTVAPDGTIVAGQCFSFRRGAYEIVPGTGTSKLVIRGVGG